ncbi:MAG TPA: RNA-binding S4 domain-containing protein [Sphingobacteriaceae bacterium]|nr:RNA-binding S4 domain-containing protein [Sphingobacteriaceae bacterium]
MIEFKPQEEYIPLIALLKALHLVESGGEAQLVVDEGLVKCNGKVELRRRFKVRPGHIVEFNGQVVKVI